ncbi:hypothetical protein C8R43DRAFT_1005030 [Mycena crocata]|nr:hypothetical protein C8R43DRAFT_1005030 [Mycena crocata]
MSLSTEPEDVAEVLRLYGAYPFSSDDEYQSGLASILAGGALENNPPEDIKEEILRRTRVFYFNRVTGNTLSMDAAREYEHAKEKTGSTDPFPIPEFSAADSASPGDSEVLSFAQLQALIEAGKADLIPNNKIIPEDLNDAPPSTSAAPVRKKPWEVETDQVA